MWLQQSIRYFDQNLSTKRSDGTGPITKMSDMFHTSSFPTRLLDLGDQKFDSFGDVRLISQRSGLLYVALSHRWGSSQHLTTTRSNLSQHMLGIRFAELPKTFRDSISVARYLGVRYLWIDALCIIQDDKIDWHREALLMGNIYQGALCTIAVHDALDDSAGFLEDSLRPPSSISLGSVHDGTDSTVSLRSNFRASVEKSGLSRRGWVLQERFLSTRTLHFTKKSIFFEDGRGVTTEEAAPTTIVSSERLLPAPTDDNHTSISSATTSLEPSANVTQTVIPIGIGHGKSWNQPDAEDEGRLSKKVWPLPWWPKKIVIRPFNHCAWILNDMDYEYQWFELLERYSTTQLTFESDKLPAISGLVKSFQKHTCDFFISGTWVRTFHIGLLWAAFRSPLRRPNIRRAASWSWASMDGPIQHPSLRHGYTCSQAQLEFDVSFKTRGFIDTICPLILYAKMRLLNHLSLEPKENVEVPLFFSRTVHVHQMFGVKRFKPLILFSPKKIEEEQRKCRPRVGLLGFATLDDGPMHQEPQEYWCIDIAGGESGSSWVLLVTSSLSSPGCWRRVGMGLIRTEMNEQPWFQNVPITRITLV